MKAPKAPLALLLPAAVLLIGAGEPQHYQSSPERRTVTDTRDWGPWAGPFREKLVPSMMQDFGERYLYAPANAALKPATKGDDRVVFLGDSITDMWDLGRYFPGKAYVNRGIGAQVTAQMLVRFQQDVVALQPRAVVILGGVNDVSGFLQMESEDGIVANIEAMADIADRHGIRVVLCSILPVTNTPTADYVIRERKPDELRRINTRLQALAKARGYAFADYYSALADTQGLMDQRFTKDGVHPLAEGYARMAPIAKAAIERTLGRK
ncbi:GDSL-type esterase/lipase family protein [Novosphingobium sp. KA1]|uniref:GDSL-type esterase/lipase family protein n=1 Tax=Novosphingobium sp. (strain KA1) TaxID=164608 RepID=UPI001A8D144F|nr:GDSL-type esterase/lipase family protein [Novosphingobium sp. KA1]QSR19788.1 GDSL family lipase [Novosphingobium sp. KA1]